MIEINNFYPHTVLTSEELLKTFSPIPNAFNIDEIIPIIPIAEAIHITTILGTPLYEDLKKSIEEETISPEYKTLLLEIQKPLGIAVVYESLPFLAYHISEKGITLGKSENSEPINSVDYTNIAMHLQQMLPTLKSSLKKFLEENASSYPLYKSDECECGEKNNNGGCIYNSNRKNFGIR